MLVSSGGRGGRGRGKARIWNKCEWIFFLGGGESGEGKLKLVEGRKEGGGEEGERWMEGKREVEREKERERMKNMKEPS